MAVYFPWSERVLSDLLKGHDKGELSALDLELTAKCSQVSCIYCDSKPDVGKKNPNELNYQETEALLDQGKALGLKWIYICGLGEPLEDERFVKMAEKASSLGIRISMFTNGLMIDQEKAFWLKKNGVCLILKMDSFNAASFDKILGRKGAAQKIYDTIGFLLNAGYSKGCEEGYTDLAFSIVPTAFNIKDIEEVILFTKKNNIFPSIGELEHAGRAHKNTTYSVLSVDEAQTSELKDTVDRHLGGCYARPICPSIIAGVHINDVGNCIVDGDTGLNCKWFMLENPAIKVLGNIREDSLATLFSRVKEYRKKCFAESSDGLQRPRSTEYIFGGCGGSPKRIMHLAENHL
ncbi:MAG: radical SAM protein [Bdellovibrionales bacterium]